MKDVVIVGGGVQGLMIAYDLSVHGHKVTVLEAAGAVGGLAGAVQISESGPALIDRFYHCILSSDRFMNALCQELDLQDKLHFTPTQMAFFGKDGGLHQMSTPKQFLTFPLISPLARVRLGASIVWSNLRQRPGALESISMEKWLRRTAGSEVYETLWGPLLQSKFDDDFGHLPASYMWARLKRMMSTRDSKGVEEMGHLEGGYQTLIDHLAAKVRAAGGQILTGVRVEALERDADTGRVRYVETTDTDGQARRFEGDAVVLTVSNGLIRRWLGDDAPEHVTAPLDEIGYMAIVCVLLVLDRSLSPYYTINILDRGLSLTGVIETTNIIDPRFIDGNHLIYLPKYCSQDSDLLERDDDDILDDFLGQLSTVLPHFKKEWIVASRVMRARQTEPVHRMAPVRRMVPYDPGIPGIFISNSTQVYPDLVNCEAMAANVHRALSFIHAELTPAQNVGATSLSRKSAD